MLQAGGDPAIGHSVDECSSTLRNVIDIVAETTVHQAGRQPFPPQIHYRGEIDLDVERRKKQPDGEPEVEYIASPFGSSELFGRGQTR